MEKIRHMLISPDITVKQAMKKMDESAEKIVFAVNESGVLVGCVTDGDMRRYILKGLPLGGNVSKVLNISPITITEGATKKSARELMVSKSVECLPVVDLNGKIVSAMRWRDLFDGKKQTAVLKGVPVVIMAGGTGSRLSPITNFLPKPLIPIGDKPIIEKIMEKFSAFGCRDFSISVNFKANILKAYFSELKHDFRIRYAQEKKPLGTIGSLQLLKKQLAKPFFVSNCDIIIEADYADIYASHVASKNDITLVVSMKHYTIPYGICEMGINGKFKGIAEKPEYDFLVNTGLYVMSPSVLKDIPVDKLYHATHLIADYLKRSKKVGVYPISENSWFDMGEWQEMNRMLKRFG
ncbi:MAG: hypothetical protein A2089_11310 [Elusimicrobia bacterium GWD2_63_28]|nr:MAG: hypothetical protein A2089_11310 [Elusimicrobia bacterium GWD2_63_28]